MKNILIIGASSGIGAAVAKLVSANNNVYATYYKNCVANYENVSFHPLNVLEETLDFSYLPETLDGLVYCPGAVNLKPFARTKTTEFIDDYNLQVMGAVKVIQAILPKLKLSSTASIVLFSSVAVQCGFTFHSIISASKGALEGLTRALSAELAPGIRVNCIAPSITQTPLTANLINTPEKIESNAQRHPLKRIGSPDDIANAVAFLISEDSKWVTGQVLKVDGGLSVIR